MTQLVRYEEMRRAIQAARNVDEAKDIRDKATALETYAKQREDYELEAWVSEIKARAWMRIGELSRELEPHPRARGGRVITGDHPPKAVVLKNAGISHGAAVRAERLASHAAEVEAYIAAKVAQRAPVSIKDVLRTIAKRTKQAAPRARLADGEFCTVADLAALPGGGFGTLYADPPWNYGNQFTRGANTDHYVGMSVDEICALPVARLAAEKSHLHLWTTNGFLFEAKRVLEAWGFEYKSCFVWVKRQIGMGNYWRLSHEFLLLGVRGGLTFTNHRERSWLETKRTKHSEKPEEIRAAVQRVSPGPRLELFGRRAVRGWTVWGNEIRRDLLDTEVAA